ncbi:LPXTG cell wall anchor domain-containing protein [Ilumatobacter sp.]|uniref:LPXTG cell wall anchor domain-containing protein n=1 Tax=Ilumatobacter sp. TaxID=1967498 RepID=UPI003C4D3EE0
MTINGSVVADQVVPIVNQQFLYNGFVSASEDFAVLATFDRGNGPIGVTLTAEAPDTDCRPAPPVYPPTEVVTNGTCETGDATVFVSVETTTYDAVWNEETLQWEPVANPPTVVGFDRPLTQEEQAACQPPANVEETEWVDGIYECGDTEVEQTRTVTTTPYIYVEGQIPEWVLDTDNAVSVEETRIRQLNADEITVCPVLEFQVLGPACVGNIPYIRWNVSGEGFDTALPLTITLSQGANVIQTIENAPAQGQVIWPGASANPPDWPGWRLNDAGVWVEDPSDAVLRDDITVTASVNPETSGTVSYPEATSECADPPPTPTTTMPGVTTTVPGTDTTTSTTPKSTLPATGGDSMSLVVLASLILLLGSGAVIVTRRRKSIS